VGEGLGRYPTAGRALDPIVTNGSGCIQSVGDLGATDLALIVGSVAPHPGEAVRLQFETDGQRPTLTGVGLLQQYAYTVDGSDLGEVEDETFSADTAVVNITGHDVHPGHAKNVMINAAHNRSRPLRLRRCRSDTTSLPCRFLEAIMHGEEETGLGLTDPF
jgi:hypothetical protein